MAIRSLKAFAIYVLINFIEDLKLIKYGRGMTGI
jgi:hypothetical protein